MNTVMDLSVVIISWRMKSMLEGALKSIKDLTHGIAYELIVVDNNSQDGTADMVRRAFPEVTLIVNPQNRGVGPARNAAFKISRGRYVASLDADIILKENSLKKMVDFMDKTPDAGVCGCKLVFPDMTIQPSARRYPTPMAFLLRRLKFIPAARNSLILRQHEMSEWDRSDVRTVDYVIGACQMVRRAAIEAVGLFDERIFYGPEDIDYCLRMYRKGWKVYYFPLTSIIHFEQRITKRRIFSKLSFMHLKGIVYLFLKYRGKLFYR